MDYFIKWLIIDIENISCDINLYVFKFALKFCWDSTDAVQYN